MTTEDGQLLNAYTVIIGAGLAVDATAGDTTITLDDASDFDPDGGSLLIGGQTVTYTAVDDDTNVVTLGSALSANAATGDRVDVWDTGLGEVATETRALVGLPGSLANDDPIDAVVAHSLAPLVELGIRDPGTGESVTMNERGDEWTVVDVRGKRAVITATALPVALPTVPSTALNLNGTAYESVPRAIARDDISTASGKLYLAGVLLPAGMSVGHLSLYCGVSGSVTPTHCWFALFDSSFTMLAVTADATTAAWATETIKTLAIANTAAGAASTFTTTYTGVYYVGMSSVASSPPTLRCQQGKGGSTLYLAATWYAAESVFGGLTTPPTFPYTPTVQAAISQPWCAVDV